MARESALTAAIGDENYSVSFTDGNNDNQKQMDQVNAFIAKNVDALVVVPADSEAIVPAINAAESAGIPVVCLGIAASSGNFTFVGSENYDAGYMQGEYMAEILPQNAKVLYCAGTAGLEHSAARREGFLAALDEKGRSDITILADQDGDYVKDEAMRICDAWIQTYSDGQGGVSFDAIVCANDQMALGCKESLKGAGIPVGDVLISGVDGTDEAIAAVADGSMAQTILQDAPGQGEACFDALKKLIAGESVDSQIIVPFQSITSENVANYQ
jgi:inositol transport system substrate-binding protein